MLIGRLLLIAAAAWPVASLVAGSRGATQAACSPLTAANVDDCVRMHQIQVLGTHNSYHVAQTPGMLRVLGDSGRNLEYTHRPLVEQLSQLGIRQFELDVFADRDGGHFSSPAAVRMVADPAPVDPALRAPGFKVLHVPDVDYRSTCPTLIACLQAINAWSEAHPLHVPIMIMIEAKDAARADPKGLGYVKPQPIDSDAFRALDREIRSVFGPHRLITPDAVRGRHATLNQAIASDGWPSLRVVRGKVVFALDNTDHHRADYLRGNPSLEGRVLFVSAEPGDPAAAFLKMNEAVGPEGDRIRELATQRYLIRTRSDVPTVEARNGDTTRRDRAFRSGAHYVSTDYPEPSPFGSGYIARLPGAEQLPARCNPVTAPAGCRDAWLEPAFPSARR